MKLVGKVVISLISILVVVGVVIGVVVAMKKSDKENKEVYTQNSMKTVTSICEMTNYKDSCAASLEETAKNTSATAKDYIMAVVGAPLEEVRKAIQGLGKVNVNNQTDPNDVIGIQDCNNLLEYAVDTLQASISLVATKDIDHLSEIEQELLSWMSGVYALQTTCLDQINNPEYKSAVNNGMLNATQLTHNAVKVVAEMSQILTVLGAQQPLAQQQHRSLLQSDGYPTWFKAADRKLLAKKGKGKKGKGKKGKGKKGKGRGRRGAAAAGAAAAVAGAAAVIDMGPNVVVAQDGSGQFTTVNQAVAAYPPNHQGRFTIYVKAGVYDEMVIVDKKKPNIFMYGDGIDRTIITGNRNSEIQKIGTMHTATFQVEAIGFMARGITFRNTAGPEGHQAVAFRSQGDMTAMFDCSFEANQDTLYYQTFRQFYRNCRIYGTVDFIFGKGQAVIQYSEIVVRRGLPKQFNTVTADGKEIREGSNGLVIQNCRIVPDNFLYPARFEVETYLGRPWTPLALTVVMQSELGDFIRPEGWRLWDGSDNHKTCEMYEFDNNGPGAVTGGRNKEFSHFKILDFGEAARFTPGLFLAGQDWLPQTGVPYKLGL